MILLAIGLQIPAIQNKLVQSATSALSKSLNTEVSVENVSIDFLNHIHLHNILIRDYKNDTMIVVKQVNTYHFFDFNPKFKLTEDKIKISGIKILLDNTYQDSTFNITKTFRKNHSKHVNSKINNESKNSSSFLTKLIFKSIELNDIQFRLKDLYNYQTIDLNLNKLSIDGSSIRISDSVNFLNELIISEPQMKLTHHVSPYIAKDYEPDYLNIPFQANIKKLKIENGQFRVFDEREQFKTKSANVLSFSDLHASSINLEVENAIVRHHHVAGKIHHFLAEEKSGLAIKEMKADFFLNSYHTIAKQLSFKTNHSIFKGNLSFHYKHMRQYLRFAEWVKVSAQMNHSKISVKDLAYFSPSLRSQDHLSFNFSGQGSGTMNHLLFNNLNANLDKQNLKLNGTLGIHDLFNGKGIFLDANLKSINFDKKDIAFVFKNKSLPEDMIKLGTMNYQGKFQGDIQKFELNGHLNSNLGSANIVKGKMDLKDMNSPFYSGQIIFNQFNFSEIIPSNNIVKNLNANLIIDGKGFDINRLNSSIKGTIKQVQIGNGFYSSIDLDGKIIDKVYIGKVISKDKKLHFIADGKLSMKDDIPNIELNLLLDKIDINKLGLVKKPLLLSAEIFAIGKGKSIDEMLGSMLISKMSLIDLNNNFKVYPFSNLTVEKDVFESGDKYLDISSDEINASLVGKYKVTEIPNVIKSYLIDYLTIGEINANENIESTTAASVSYFNLNLNFKNISSYTKLIYEPLKNIGEGTLSLKFNGIDKKMNIKGILKNTELLDFKIPYIDLSSLSNRDLFESELNFDSVFIQNKLAITPLKATIKNLTDGLKLSVELLNKSDDKFVDFNSIIKKRGDIYQFNILPFTSYFGRKVWAINPDNVIQLSLSKQLISIQNLDLSKDIQEINISTENESNLLKSNFRNVKLEELISGFLPILNTFKGELNGQVDIANLMTKPTPIANLDIKNISYDQEKIGNIVLKSSFKDNILESQISMFGDKIKFNTTGSYNLNLGQDSVYISNHIDKFDMGVLNKYLKDVVYEMQGDIHGDLIVSGKLNHLKTEGSIVIDSLSTYLNNIHTKYFIKNQNLSLVANKIIFDNFNFKDEEGNDGLAYGFITHKNFDKFDLNLNVESNKMLCMNSKAHHNPYFYGKLYANAKAQFRGMIGDRIYLNAQGENLSNSNLYITFGSSQRTEKFNFYEFIEKGNKAESQAKKFKKKLSGVNLDFNFDINKEGKVFIIMDPESEDKIECTGSGAIAFKLTPETDMDVKGSYEINSGTYLFTYQNLVQRVFYLNKGGKMTFVGNPRASLIDASAKFTTRASAQDLVNAYNGSSSNSKVQSAAKNSVKVNILLNLKEKMMSPKISYELDLEQNNSEVQSAFEAISATTKNNESELNKQVMGLLVFQRFFPPSFTGFNNNTSSNGSVVTDLQNTFFDVMTGKLSGYVTDWIQNTFRGMNFNLNYRRNSQFDQQVNTTDIRNELKAAVSQKLVNDRLIFNVGFNYDFGSGVTNSTNNLNRNFFGGDIDLEYLLSPQGNLRLKAYSTLSNDPLSTGYVNKTGAGILYQKEFNKLNELFKSKSK